MGKHNILPTGPGALSPGFSHESNEPGDPIAGPSRHLPTSQPIPGWQSPGGWQCPGLQVRWQRQHNAWLPFLPPAWSLTLELQAQGKLQREKPAPLVFSSVCDLCSRCWMGRSGELLFLLGLLGAVWALLLWGFRASPGTRVCQEKSPLGWHESQFSTCSEKHSCSQLPTMTYIWQELEK